MSSAAGDPQNKGRRIPVLMDCDPGHDDMMAIILASMSDRIELLGVTTVAGNQTGTKTFQNARRVLKLIGAEDVPVVRGFDRPLFRELVTAPQFHGVSGLDGADLPEIEEPAARGTQPHAVEFLARTIREHSEAVTLVPTGPLTNIGALLRQYPELTSKIKRIVLMGGAFRDSNIIPGAEYNIYVDPEAARAVFLSGVPVTMVGLDVTNKAQLTRGELDRVADAGGEVTRVISPLLEFFREANKEIFGFPGPPLHDALAVAAVIEPSVIETESYFVDVECRGELTRGQTVVDSYGMTGNEANVEVALGLDRVRFAEMMLDALDAADRRVVESGR